MGRVRDGHPRRVCRRGIAEPRPFRCGLGRLHVRDPLCDLRHHLPLRDVAPAAADAMYWRRGWQLFFRPRCTRPQPRPARPPVLRRIRRQPVHLASAGALRGAAHWLIMWGCVLAAAITFPLVLGWIHFETVPGDLDSYRAYVVRLPDARRFRVESVFGFLIFHGLVWASFLVIVGVMLAFRRRMHRPRRRGGTAVRRGHPAADLALRDQRHRADADGELHVDEGLRLRLPGDPARGDGDLHAAVAAVRQVLPHLPAPGAARRELLQGRRPDDEQARCRRCGEPFASRLHVEDLIGVERVLGYRYELGDPTAEHYQWVCPVCRRKLLGLAQRASWHPEPCIGLAAPCDHHSRNTTGSAGVHSSEMTAPRSGHSASMPSRVRSAERNPSDAFGSPWVRTKRGRDGARWPAHSTSSDCPAWAENPPSVCTAARTMTFPRRSAPPSLRRQAVAPASPGPGSRRSARRRFAARGCAGGGEPSARRRTSPTRRRSRPCPSSRSAPRLGSRLGEPQAAELVEEGPAAPIIAPASSSNRA